MRLLPVVSTKPWALNCRPWIRKSQEYEIEGGVVVKISAKTARSRAYADQDGFIITSVNGRDISNVQELTRLLASLEGTAANWKAYIPDMMAPTAIR